MYSNFNPNNNPNQYNPYNNPYNNNFYTQQYFEQQKKLAYYKMKRENEKSALIKLGVLLGGAILVSLIMQVVFVTALKGTPYFNVYKTSSVFQNCFNVVAVHMTSMLIPFGLVAFIERKKLTVPLVPLKKTGFVNTAAWTCLGMGCCIAANYIVNFIIVLFKQFGYKLNTPEMLKADSVLACITLVVSTAIVPAIFEEFAFRCCAMGVLRQYGKGFAAFAVSIIFGLIHGNFIQFAFAFIIGMVLAFVTIKTDSIIPAMLIHGLNNGISVTQEILTYTSGKKLADSVAAGLFVLWVCLAIGALIFLVYKKELKGIQPRAEKEPYALSLPAKLLCLLPGLALPFLILIALSKQFITKV